MTASDGLLTSSATVIITVQPSATNQPPIVNAGPSQIVNLQDNLVKNYSNELGLAAGQIPNWTTVTGTWSAPAAGTGGLPAAFQGSSFFYAGSSPTAEVSQDVDVSAWTGAIQSQTQQFEFEAWVRSAAKQTPDSTRIIVEFRGGILFGEEDTGPITATDEWTRVSGTFVLPPNTLVVRIRLLATRNSGTTNDAYFDEVTLRPIGTAAAHLNGMAIDDGLPAGLLDVHWSLSSGTNNVQFANPKVAVTAATFDATGVYGLTLTGTDSVFSVGSNTGVTVLASNQAPVVNAGQNQSVTLPATAKLLGEMQDDALPANATVTTTWSMVSGPGTVTFSAPNQLATTAAFSAPGQYLLRLAANDTQYVEASDITIDVSGAPPANQPPVVNAGANQTIILPANSASLIGSATDPSGGTLTYLWTEASGPGGVTFAAANQPATTVTFPGAGIYQLKLTATSSASQLSASGMVTITVNGPLTVNAGATQTITLPANSVTLNGTVTDPGLPQGATVTVTWSEVSGPVPVMFANASQASTTATFPGAGTYVLQLSATDGTNNGASQVTIHVLSQSSG
ncbi:MAG: PKD domain-containing protein, partial [Blastocatellia bacterium]